MDLLITRFAHVCDVNTCSKQCIDRVRTCFDEVTDFMEEFVPSGAQYSCFISLHTVCDIIEHGTVDTLPSGYKEVFRGVYKVGNRLFTYDNSVSAYTCIYKQD